MNQEKKKPTVAVLTLYTSMLPSINRKNRVSTSGGIHLYTTREYKAAIKQMRADVQIQVAATKWKTAATDRYLILAQLPFLLAPGETWTTLKCARDVDNPWKPMQDVLEYRHRALYDDSQVEQVCFFRRWTTDPRQMLARLTIARFHQEAFHLFPIESFFDQWASQWYTVHRVNH